MPTMADPGTQLASVEDLGGPTPENYKPTMIQQAEGTSGTLKQVRDVVTKSAGKADPMPAGMKEDEELSTEDTIEEEETVTDEVVAEEETTETVAEYDIEEDVNALLGGEELTEEFKEKAKTIFEAAINKSCSVKRNWSRSMLQHCRKKSKLLRNPLQSVSIPTWSMSLTSGS